MNNRGGKASPAFVDLDISGASTRLSILLVLLKIFLATNSSASVLKIYPKPQSFSSIQSAINTLRSGDTLLLGEGRYDGNFTVDRKLSIMGDPIATINGSDSGDVITLTSDSCHLANLIILHGGKMQLGENSGLKVHSNHNVVENCKFDDNTFGIYFFSANYNVVRNTEIHGRSSVDMNQRGNGIHLHDSKHNLIDHVHIYETRDGIYFDFADSNTVLFTRVEYVRYGFHYMYSNDNLFENCYLSNNVAGAALMYSNHGLTFRNNIFIHNVGYRAYGILYKDCNKGLAENNLIIDNTTGMFFDNSHKNVTRWNIIALSGVAVRFYMSSEYDIFYENNFVDNLSSLVLAGGKGEILWDQHGRGNYWSNAHTYDLDGDGVGDTPHIVESVFDYIQGEYPLFNLYMYSPAAQALQFAERTIPVIVGGLQIDHYPLMKPVCITCTLAPTMAIRRARHFDPLLFCFSFFLLVCSALVVTELKRVSM